MRRGVEAPQCPPLSNRQEHTETQREHLSAHGDSPGKPVGRNGQNSLLTLQRQLADTHSPNVVLVAAGGDKRYT